MILAISAVPVKSTPQRTDGSIVFHTGCKNIAIGLFPNHPIRGRENRGYRQQLGWSTRVRNWTTKCSVTENRHPPLLTVTHIYTKFKVSTSIHYVAVKGVNVRSHQIRALRWVAMRCVMVPLPAYYWPPYTYVGVCRRPRLSVSVVCNAAG